MTDLRRWGFAIVNRVSFLTSTVFAAAIGFAEAVQLDAPFAYWRFGVTAGATAAIDSASGLDGTCCALGIMLGQAGIDGGDSGALFDGLDGRVIVPDDPILGPDSISMEALFRWDGPNGLQQRILRVGRCPR